jgi:tetratricopeptide (TPR) repeat protein
VAEGILGVDEVGMSGDDFNSDDAKAWFDRGNSLCEEGRFEEAITSYDRAILYKPDFHETWYNRGSALDDSGRYEEAIKSYDRAIFFNPDYHKTWYNRGNSLGNSGRYEESIASYDRAISLSPDHHKAWFNRGNSLDNLGRYEEAIESYDRAISLNSDHHEAWYSRGNSLASLGRYEESIASYDRAISLNSDYHKAWFNRGVSLDNLGRCEEAIESYDRAISFESDRYEPWARRGVSLGNLDRYEEAIESYDRAISFKIDLHEIWHKRGFSLGHLDHYEEAIESYDQAILFKPDYYESWYNRGLYLNNLGRYEEAINNNETGLSHLQSSTHPEGWGLLHQGLGGIHYRKGLNNNDKFPLSPRIYYNKALAAFQIAETTLPAFPELHLELIQDFVKVYLALDNSEAANSYREKGLKILLQTLDNRSSLQQKRQLLAKFNSFRQLEVDILLRRQQPILALEIAELTKNLCLETLLSALSETIVSPSYPAIQNLLQPGTAIIYWHLSPTTLSTFILQPGDHQPHSFYHDNLTELQNWIADWDKVNIVASQPTDTKKKTDNTQLQKAFATLDWPKLAAILNIDKIQQQLQNPTALILIPHKDLHRLPLHQFFEIPVTYLPSLQIALNLTQKTANPQPLQLDLIQPPSGSDLPHAEIEIATINSLMPNDRHLPSDQATKENLLELLQTANPHSRHILHFTGHGQHFARRPQESCIYLNNNETLTCPELAQQNLTPYHLIVLAACQTSIVQRQTLNDEYVGLISACLSGGASYAIAALWNVRDIASSPFFIYFYQQLAQQIPVPQALHNTSHWLRQATNRQLHEFYTHLSVDNSNVQDKIRRIADRLATAPPQDCPYQDPYYWAAFIVSGMAPELK